MEGVERELKPKLNPMLNEPLPHTLQQLNRQIGDGSCAPEPELEAADSATGPSAPYRSHPEQS